MYLHWIQLHKIWDLVAQKVFYSRSVIFKETEPSLTMQPKQIKEKKYLIQLPAIPRQVELRLLEGQVIEESSKSTKSLEEEGEFDHEPEPKPKSNLLMIRGVYFL